MDTHTLHRIGILSLVLLLLTAVGAAKVGGPEPRDGQMVIMDRGQTTASQSGTAVSVNDTLLDAHLEEYSIDVSFASASQSTTAPVANSSCGQDIAAAQDMDEDQLCTQQIATMSCPDADVTHEARNGCVISALKERGWTRAGGVTGEPNVTNTHSATLSADLTFRTAGYSVDVSEQVVESYPSRAGFVVNISSPDGPAAQVLTDRSVTEELSYDQTRFQSARVTVMIDGQEVYLKTFRPGSGDPGHGTDDAPVDSGRINRMEARINQLEQQVAALSAVVEQHHPGAIEEEFQRRDELGNQSSGPGTPGSETGQQERPGFVNRVLGAIFG